MPSFKHIQPHTLGLEDARNRVSNLVGELQTSFGSQITNVESSWKTDTLQYSFKVFGSNISGTVEVFHDKAELTVSYPLIFSAFKSNLETIIRQKATTLLS